MTPDFNRGDRLVKKQILSLNRHLPRKRKFLDELLKEEKPHVVGGDGIKHRFKKDELSIIKEILGESELHLLKLPIYIEIDSNAAGSKISGRLEIRLSVMYWIFKDAVMKLIYTDKILRCFEKNSPPQHNTYF